MRTRILLTVLLVVLSPRVSAQPSSAPDRGPELMQLQYNARATQPPPASMDGTRATAIYKRFSDPGTHSAPAQPAPAATSGSSP
jgi:hypothetical protein